jgi:hypothetical protein
MTETLTESFCERCGTRYTFESARPRVRLKGVKVLSRGLKNFVLSDGSTMDEAMAAARNDTDRELTSHQLDAFHATFNFCMSCRQYTCPNCWNDAEARCLSCAPRLGDEVMPAPFPDLPAAPIMVGDRISANGNGSNGTARDDDSAHRDDEIDFAARLATLTGAAGATDDAMAEEARETFAAEQIEAKAPGADVVAAKVQPVGPEIAAPIAAQSPFDTEDRPPTPAWLAALAAGAAVDAWTSDELATGIGDKTAGQTGGMLKRFRPGQSAEALPDVAPDVTVDGIAARTEAADDVADGLEAAVAIEAAARAAAEVEAAAEIEAAATQAASDVEAVARAEAAAQAAEVVEAERAVQAAAEQGAAQAAAEQEAARAAAAIEAARAAAVLEATARAEAEREAAERAAQLEAAAQTEAKRVVAENEAAARAEAETAARAEAEAAAVQAAAAARAEDIVRQPTWRMVAPDPSAEAPTGLPGDPAAATPPLNRDPNAEPQWPSRPGAVASGLPFLGRPPAAQGGLEALWAESNREVVSTPLMPGKSVTGGVQPCLSCGLSLSANARFCRRCGTPQAS